jgi:hypothetical protein
MLVALPIAAVALIGIPGTYLATRVKRATAQGDQDAIRHERRIYSVVLLLGMVAFIALAAILLNTLS